MDIEGAKMKIKTLGFTAILIITIVWIFRGLNEPLIDFDFSQECLSVEDCLPLAEKGDAEAQYFIGAMYSSGMEVPDSFDFQGQTEEEAWYLLHAEALKWYLLAAEQGHSMAQSHLGSMYSGGTGVPQDYKEAMKWYLLAANQGYGHAQYNLGEMYYYGRGVPQDYKEAMKWYLPAVEQETSHCLALQQVVSMYYYGHGVPQDHDEALKWFRKGNRELCKFWTYSEDLDNFLNHDSTKDLLNTQQQSD
jgi:TPR repeat protein